MPKVAERVPMSAAEIDDADVDAVVRVLRSGRLALGPQTVQFENDLKKYVGTKHAIAVNSGTAALHLLVRANGLGPKDEVLVPSFTFAASVNAILYENAKPVFVDVERETYNLDPEDVRKRITKQTKAIMAVDIFGHPAEWDELTKVAEEHDLVLIDDSCEALGAEYRGTKLGSFGQAGAFAFYPNKQMTTGEGGIIVTDDDEVAELCQSMRNQGRGKMGSWLEHARTGYNYRIDEMSAALGVSQLSRIESFLKKREAVARRYTNLLKDVDGVSPPRVKKHVRMSWFVYVVTLEKGIHRDKVIAKMEAEGVPARGYFAPIHTQPYLRAYVPKPPKLPVTEEIATRTLALPFHNNLSQKEAEIVVEALGKAVGAVGHKPGRQL